MNTRKLKISICREEYFAITGNLTDAIILNQMIYWSERVEDFDKFIESEMQRAYREDYPISPKQNGWFYKSAEELSEETMLCLSKSNMREHIKKLVALNFIEERTNPNLRWDKTKQYRVNLFEIIKSLNEKGYVLSNYKVTIQALDLQHEYHKTEHPVSYQNMYIPNQNESSSKTELQYHRLLTETSTENKEYEYDARAREKTDTQENVKEDEYGNPIADKEWLRIQNCYIDNLRIQFPGGIRNDDLWDYYNSLGADVVCYGIEETARNAGDSNTAYKYLITVLESWKSKGIKNVQDAKLESAKHQRNAKASKQSTRRPSDLQQDSGPAYKEIY